MAEEEVLEEAGGGDSMGVIILMLGLYLIVLAFFILLNAISEDSKERRDIVVESVREGFDFKDEGNNAGPDETEITVIPLYESFNREIEGVVETYLALDEFDVKVKSEKLFVSMDIRRFFRKGERRLIPEMVLFFEDLAEVLSNPKPGLGYITQVIVQSDESEVGDASMSALELAGRRSTLFLRALLDEGVKKQFASAGARIDAPRIHMQFEIFISDHNQAMGEARRLHETLQGVLGPAENNQGASGTPSKQPIQGGSL
jgi:hypothetical protein